MHTKALARAVVSLCVATLLGAASPARGQDRARKNYFGMHNLKDGGVSIPEGMNWTRHMVGEGGYVFDWVRGDYGRWVVDAMDRGLIPCLRIQDCNGGCEPDPGFPATVTAIIREHLEQHRPQYLDRLVYLQLWNEPGDPRDLVTPEDFADFLVAAHSGVKQADSRGVFRTMTPGQNGPDWWRRAIRHNPAVCHFTGAEYLDQLVWYDGILREDDYVLGATIFALEIPGWGDFDIAPIVDALGDYVASQAPPP